LTHTIRVDPKVKAVLDAERRPEERNYNNAIWRFIHRASKPQLVVAKRHVQGSVFEAVVMDRENKVVYASGLGWNKRGKADCQRWIEEPRG
jgi:hypothetical protein